MCHSDKQLEGEGSREDGEMSLYGLTQLMTVPLESEIDVTADLVGKERKMSVFHQAMKVGGSSLQVCEVKGSVKKYRELVNLDAYRYWYCTALISRKVKACEHCGLVLR